MDSSSSRLEEAQRKQAEIRKQIALLQAQLDVPDQGNSALSPMALASPKRKQSAETYLIPATPSPSELTLWHITLLNDPELNQRRESWTIKRILASPILSPLGVL
jgi:hypothetical protein